MFKVEYDTQAHDIISAVDNELKKFGLMVFVVEEGDGYMRYKIDDKPLCLDLEEDE